jgi:hypothetical protein
LGRPESTAKEVKKGFLFWILGVAGGFARTYVKLAKKVGESTYFFLKKKIFFQTFR